MSESNIHMHVGYMNYFLITLVIVSYLYIYTVCKGKQVENFLRKSSIKALNKCIKQFWQSMYFLYFYKIWDLEFVSKYSLSTRQFLISSFYVEKSDTKIHSYMYYFCVCFYFIILLCFLCVFLTSSQHVKYGGGS